MKRDRLLAGIVIVVLVVTLAWAVFWHSTVKTQPPKATRQPESPRDQQALDSSFAREATQSVERALSVMPARSPTGEVASSSSPVPLKTPPVAVIASNAGNTGIKPIRQEESSQLPNESVPVVKLDTVAIATATSEYIRLFGSCPAGNNAAISKALAGENPKKIVLLAFKHVGKGGEMLDPWGNPFDIQFTEDGRLRIHSGGSNQTMGDADDILLDHPIRSGKASPPAVGSR
jgi:hypothetical protein